MKRKQKMIISGSFRRHLKEIGIARDNFIKSGIKVLAPLTHKNIGKNENFVFLTTDDLKKSGEILEREFMEHIKKSHFLYVVNPKGYIGQSAATELGVALMNGIPVVVSEEIKKISEKIPKTVQQLLKRSIFKELHVGEISSQKITELNLPNFIPVNLSIQKRAQLQSLVEKLLRDLKFVRISA